MSKANAATLNVAEAKKRFSEIINEVVYHHKRFLVGRHGEPVIGIVPVSEVGVAPTTDTSPKGFLSLVGLWSEVKNLDALVKEIYRSRSKEKIRPVPLFDE